MAAGCKGMWYDSHKSQTAFGSPTFEQLPIKIAGSEQMNIP